MVTREWSVTPRPDGRLAVSDGHRTIVADAVRDGGTVWVWLDGEWFEFAPPAARRSTRAADDDAALMPQMSAKVIRVAVAAGAAVRAGDVLVVLEAMKMEMPVRAPRDGVVRAVHCAAGDLVQPGRAVVDLGPAAAEA